MVIYTKQNTILISVEQKENGKTRTKNITCLVKDKSDKAIQSLKDEIATIIAPITEKTEQSIILRYRKDSSHRIGGQSFHTTMNIDEVHEYILSKSLLG